MKAQMGLRERKKRMQRQELLDIAARLFRQHGFDETRMEDVAIEANVSTKTVYNYFPNKQRILTALLEEDRSRLVSAYEAVLANPPTSLPDAVAALMQADIGDVLTTDDKKLWRELISAELRTSKSSHPDMTANNQIFLSYIESLLSHFQQIGDFNKNISVKISAEIIYSIYYHNFVNYCRSDDMCINTLKENLLNHAKTVVLSWQQ